MLLVSPHRLLLLLPLLSFLLSFGAAMAQTQNGFLSGIPDLPLMSRLKEVPDSGMVFDKPEGRIVTALATGPVAAAEVSDFYAATLPQLGWRPGPVGSYLRDGEKLSLKIDTAVEGVTVQFTLAPQ